MNLLPHLVDTPEEEPREEQPKNIKHQTVSDGDEIPCPLGHIIHMRQPDSTVATLEVWYWEEAY